jgi:hypothetical protein
VDILNTICRLEFCCVSNRLLRNHIKNVAFITFINDVITFQKTYTVQKFHTWNLISNAMCHNKDRIVHLKAMYLSPPSLKSDLTLSSMDRDAGNTSPDIGHTGNSFFFVVVLILT